MNDHELLIRHAVAWADKRRQPLDRDLLETVLQLRDFHDASAPQEWPELHRAPHEMDDLRVWRREGDRLRSTAFGHDVALLAASMIEQGMIEE